MIYNRLAHFTRISISLVCCCLLSYAAMAQKLPFFDEVQAFKKQDSIHPPVQHGIVFIGSSSFARWNNLEESFPDRTIINRAFGGSSLPDLIRYVDDITLPYQPRQIVIYCGENDFAGNDSITAKIVTTHFKKLFKLIRERLPKLPIAFVSIKPSPSREKYWSKMIAANASIKSFLKKKKYTQFIDVYSKMFHPDGTVMKDIFVEDNLHMNAKGYAIWQKVIEPYLLAAKQGTKKIRDQINLT